VLGANAAALPSSYSGVPCVEVRRKHAKAVIGGF
jgi:hypothetical protein